MLVQQMAFDRLNMRIQLQGFQGHFGDYFQSECVFDRFFAVRTPRKRPVAMDKDSRNIGGIKIFEPLENVP